jgi:hypothetical protein
MVPANSHGVSRVPCYSGLPPGCFGFRLRVSHPLGSGFPAASPNLCSPLRGPITPEAKPPVWAVPRSLATTDGITVLFSTPPVTEMFHFTGSRDLFPMYSGTDVQILICTGYPIRKSPDHSVFAAPRSLSQLITSFIARQHQGIHCVPFVT